MAVRLVHGEIKCAWCCVKQHDGVRILSKATLLYRQTLLWIIERCGSLSLLDLSGQTKFSAESFLTEAQLSHRCDDKCIHDVKQSQDYITLSYHLKVQISHSRHNPIRFVLEGVWSDGKHD